jgi:hypothetical protein
LIVVLSFSVVLAGCDPGFHLWAENDSNVDVVFSARLDLDGKLGTYLIPASSSGYATTQFGTAKGLIIEVLGPDCLVTQIPSMANAGSYGPIRLLIGADGHASVDKIDQPSPSLHPLSTPPNCP